MIWLRNFLEFDMEAPPFWQNWLIAVPGGVLLGIVLVIPAVFYVLGRQVRILCGGQR